MSNLRRILASYGRCRRYAPSYFEVTIIEVGEDEPSCFGLRRRRFTWFATAKLRNGKVFCRAQNADVTTFGQWRVRDGSEIGARKDVSDITAAFADWLESVEDSLGHVALRGLILEPGEKGT